MNPILSLQAFLLSGKEPLAAIELELAPQWHIYWDNYGDSGMQTSIDEGTLLYPTPQKIPLAGDLVSYGYKGRVVFFVENPKKKILLSWLACKEDTCIPGKKELSFQKTGQERFQKERNALPADCPFTWEHISDTVSRVDANEDSWIAPYSDLAESVHAQYTKDGAHFVLWNTKKPKGRSLWVHGARSCIIHI